MVTRTPVVPPETPPTTDAGFWTNRWTIASAILVGLIVVAGAWLLLDPAGPADTPRPTHGQSVPRDAKPGCGPAAHSQTPPATAPHTEWRLIGSMAAPSSPDTGPARTDSGIGLCFSADPAGALFAAATFVAADSDPTLRRPALDKLVARTAGYQAAFGDINLRGPGAATVGVQVAGFTFLSYRPTRDAVVDLALTSKGAFVHVPITLTWTDGDWRIVLPITGRPFDAMQSIPDLSGYVPWQGA